MRSDDQLQETNTDRIDSKLPLNENSLTEEKIFGQTYKYDPKITKIVIAILVGLILFVLWKGSYQEKNQQLAPLSARNSKESTSLLPKILWIYTDNEFESLEYPDLTMANYLVKKGHQFNYEVRLINHTSAYDWLSEEMTSNITKARSKVRLEVGIQDLLLFGILIENGGIFLRRFDSFVLDDFKWIEKGFTDDEGQHEDWSCSTKKAQVFLTTEQIKLASFPRYSDSIIAARPNSILLKKAMVQYIKISTADPLPNGPYTWMFQDNRQTLAFGAAQLVEYSLSIVVNDQVDRQKYKNEETLCSVLGLQTFKHSEIFDAAYVPETLLRNYLIKKNRNCPSKLKMIIQVKRQMIRDILSRIMLKRPILMEEGSLIHEVISVQANRHIFLEELPERQIQFCIVTLQEVKQDYIQSSLVMFKWQLYQNWTAVYIVNNVEEINQNELSQRTKLMNNTGNKGLNIEQALTKHCPHKSFAVLLNANQRFKSSGDLSQVANNVKPRGVLGSLVSLDFKGEVRVPHNANRTFYRKDQGIVNPDLPRMKDMLNHLRVFSVEVYKFLPQFQLHDSYGKYYEDRIIFIMSFYDMVRDPLDTDVNIYTIKKYAPKFDIPRGIVMSQNVVIGTDLIDEIDMDQMKRTFTRLETESMRVVVDSLNLYRISFDKMLTFNEGKHFQNFQTKKGPYLIEPIIHQAWLGGQIPPIKRYLLEKTQQMFPNFEMKLWTLQNITKENFPYTYDILKTLCEFNRYSPFNKYATMTDILRHEAVYHHGGFWKDSSMNFLKPVLNDFRRYKLAIATDKSMRHRYLQGMCFYGHVKHYEPMLRVTGFKHLNRMRIYQGFPFDIAGPVDFRWLIDRDEEYDPQILILAYETFYPGQLGQHPAGDLCTEEVNDKPKDLYESIKDNWGILKNCSQIYPQAFGIQHNRYGVTWAWTTGNNRQHPRYCEIK